ncbi:hypothetical protein B0H13DRAFT_2301822 [Mycena leptocephala]|nr:hypothetical protein B0H13DRAFT_2301822 [Mycena leptocephala]
MTKSQVSPPAPSAVMTSIAPACMPGCFLVIPFPMMVMGMALPSTAALPEAPARAAAAPAALPPAVPKPRAGLPTALVALLRDENGPFFANEVFSATPSQALEPIEEAVPAPEWYAITRGRFVGVVNQYALSDVTIMGVSASARKAYTTQALALDAFNQALVWGGVQVL